MRASSPRRIAYALDVLAALLAELVGDTATVVIPGEWTVEVSAAGVDKATALAELCDELGIQAGEVLAIGDYPNDLPMLAWAGRAVAVANAHPDVRAEADDHRLERRRWRRCRARAAERARVVGA